MTKTFVFRRPDFLDMKTRFSDLLVRTLAYIIHYTHHIPSALQPGHLCTIQ